MTSSAAKARGARVAQPSRIPVRTGAQKPQTQQKTQQKQQTQTQKAAPRRARSPPPPPKEPSDDEEEEEVEQQQSESEADEQAEASADEQQDAEQEDAEEGAEEAGEVSAEEAADAEEAEAEEQEQEAEEAEDAEDGAEDAEEEAEDAEGAEEEERAEDEEPQDDEDAEQEDAEEEGEEEDPDDDRLQAEDDAARSSSGSGSSSNQALAGDEYAQALAQRGVVYVSRIPPYMKAAKLRWLLEQLLPKHKKRARLGRIFLTPEDAAAARRRKKSGGNTGARFVDGWVEFESKKIARWMAEIYNLRPMGGPRRSRYREDLWNLQYLPGFKWHHLTEKIAYEKQVRSTRIREEMSQAKRESEHYLAQVEASRKAQQIAEKRNKKRKGDILAYPEPQKKRNFHQRSFIDQPSAGSSSSSTKK